MELPKILKSTTKIRFQDCDPFNHLNNASYFNYMINAREDHTIQNYDLDVYKHGKETGKSWVVSTHQIAYLRPAKVMETVVLESQLFDYGKKDLAVEIRMYNESKTEIKAVLWSSFVYFNILKQTSDNHSEELLSMFEKVVLPVEEQSFENRIKSFRFSKK